MSEMISLLVVPVLAFVVLSALSVTYRWSARPLSVGLLGISGVLFGGPSAIMMLGAHADEPGEAASPEAEPVDDLRIPIGAALPTSKARESVKVEWTEIEERIEGSGIDWIVVSGGPHERMLDVDRDLEVAMQKAADRYIKELLDSEYAPLAVGYTVEEIQSELRNSEFEHVQQRPSPLGAGMMKTKYVRLEFNEEFRSKIKQEWKDVVGKSRLLHTALIGGAMLAFLGVIFSYFRLDNATRGFYTGRLQFLAVGVILTIVAAGVFTARWIPWM